MSGTNERSTGEAWTSSNQTLLLPKEMTMSGRVCRSAQDSELTSSSPHNVIVMAAFGAARK
jgi:hypothetical protein